MDCISSNNFEIALIHYRLLNCNAEAKIKATPELGGIIELTSEINTPLSPTILKKKDSFVIKITIEIIGKSKDSKNTVFSASCSFEGDFRIIDCDKNGVAIKDNLKLWSLAINQLHPLASQFVSDIVLKMGFKNVNIPLILPGSYAKKALSTKEKIQKIKPPKAK